jgi:hypothetical protein
VDRSVLIKIESWKVLFLIAVHRIWFVIYWDSLFQMRRRNEGVEKGRRGWSQEGQREGQDLDNRMCFHYIMSEPRAQTFMLHARPSALCAAERVKLPPHWRCGDPTKREFAGLFGWLSCVRTQVHMSSCDMKTSPGSFETPSCLRDVHALHQVSS